VLEPIPNYEVPFNDLIQGTLDSPEAIAAGDGIDDFAVLENGLSKEDSENIATGTKLLALYGIIKYEDFLGCPHDTGFCWTLAVPPALGAIGFANPIWGSIGIPSGYRFRT
jgi:hypothetical protein